MDSAGSRSSWNGRFGDLFKHETARSAFSGSPTNCAFVWNDGYRRSMADVSTEIVHGTAGAVRTAPSGTRNWDDRTLAVMAASRGIEGVAGCNAACMMDRSIETPKGSADRCGPGQSCSGLGRSFRESVTASIRGQNPTFDPADPDHMPELLDADGNYRLSMLSQESLQGLCDDVFFPSSSDTLVEGRREQPSPYVCVGYG